MKQEIKHIIKELTDWNNFVFADPHKINKTIVHGHCLISFSKCKNRIASKLNTINIDTGCVFKNRDDYGVLTALDCYANRIVIV